MNRKREARYPSWMYHPTKGAKLFQTLPEIRQAEADGWWDSPGAWNQGPQLPDFDLMSKKEIEQWAAEALGLDLDRRRRRSDLLDAIRTAVVNR